jgi:hypothetical protein
MTQITAERVAIKARIRYRDRGVILEDREAISTVENTGQIVFIATSSAMNTSLGRVLCKSRYSVTISLASSLSISRIFL